MIDLTQSIYLSSNFAWLGHILGGFIFGIGMTIASGCGQRTLIRLGGGNLKSFVVFLVLGLADRAAGVIGSGSGVGPPVMYCRQRSLPPAHRR